jgi:hypothetical protein
MAWEHFDIRDHGLCKVKDKASGEVLDCPYERGIVNTGKSRVFAGYKLIVNFAGKEIVGRDKNCSESYLSALQDCNKQMEAVGGLLLVAGNAPGYYETGLSGGAGFGYIHGKKGAAVNIMSFYAA